jgi:hypothetical protein
MPKITYIQKNHNTLYLCYNDCDGIVNFIMEGVLFMLWLHMVIFVGLLSIFIPAMFFLIMNLKLNNLFRSLLVTIFSILFTITPTIYIYSGIELYIFIGIIILSTVLAGCWCYSFFEKHLPNQNNIHGDVKSV